MSFPKNLSNISPFFCICILQLLFVVHSSENAAIQIECDAISNTDFGRRFCFIRHLNQRILPNNITYKPNSIADEKRELIFDNCTLNTLPLGIFEHFPHIKTVYGWNVQFKYISTEVFRNANELLTLDLSKNHIERIESNAFSLAAHLTQLDLSRNHIESIDVNAFAKLNQLHILNLNYNKLSFMPAMALVPLVQLKAIHLSFNSIKMVPVELFLQNLRLQTIHLNDNSIEWLFGEQTFRHLSDVNEFDLHNNPIVNFAGCIINAESIDIRNTKARACFVGPRTKRISASNNRIEFVDITTAGAGTTTAVATTPPTQLEHMDLANNRLHSIRNLTHFERLRYLDLTNNHLHDIGLNSFARMHQLEVLNLRNSGLAHIHFGMFSHKSRLRALDLSHNELGRIDFRMFVAMKNLVQLHLNGNNLSELDATEIRRIFPALTKIGISQNDWSCHNLASIIKHLESNSIALETIETTQNTENIKGIPCKNNDDVSGNAIGSGSNSGAAAAAVAAVHDGNDARKTIAENEITTRLIEIESSQEIQTFTSNDNNVNVNEQQPAPAHTNQPSNGTDIIMSMMVRLLELKYDVQNTIQNANEVGRKLDQILQIP